MKDDKIKPHFTLVLTQKWLENDVGFFWMEIIAIRRSKNIEYQAFIFTTGLSLDNWDQTNVDIKP